MVAKKKGSEDFVMVDGIKCTTSAPLVDIDKLIPYEKNAKIHGTELEFLKNCIKDPRIGFCDPIEVDRDMVIVSGHGRRLVAIELGMTKVPCIIHKHMFGEASDAYRLEANRQSDLSGYDFDRLNFETARLKDLGWDMQSFGFEDMTMFDDMREEVADPEEVDYIEVVDGPGEVLPDFKMMVHCSSYEELRAVYERLSDEGLRCQMLD